MTLSRVVLLLAFVCATTVSGQAPPSPLDTKSIPELTKALRSELRAELVAGLDKGAAGPTARLAELEGILVEGLPVESVEEAEFGLVGQVLLRVDLISESPKARELAKELHRRLKAQSEAMARAQQEAATKNRRSAEEALQAAAQTMLKAEKAAELDAPLRLLRRVSHAQDAAVEAAPGEAVPPKDPADGGEKADGGWSVMNAAAGAPFAERVGKLLEVMERWQDLLVAAASEKRDPRGPVGDFDATPGKNAAQQLDFRLKNQWQPLEGLMERSAAMERMEVLRKMAVPPPAPPFDYEAWNRDVNEVIGKIRAPKEIEPALKKIEELTAERERRLPQYGSRPGFNGLVLKLQAIDKAHKDLDANRTVALERASEFMAMRADQPDPLTPLRKQLMRRLVPVTLGTEPIPENETIEAYARRHAAKAKAAHDWRKLGDSYYVLWVVYARTKEQDTEAGAVRSLVAAGEFERAGDVSLAVAEYLRVVKLGLEQEMLDWTAARLQALKEKSLADYERGQLLVDAPKNLMQYVIKQYPDALREWQSQRQIGPGGQGGRGGGARGALQRPLPPAPAAGPEPAKPASVP